MRNEHGGWKECRRQTGGTATKECRKSMEKKIHTRSYSRRNSERYHYVNAVSPEYMGASFNNRPLESRAASLSASRRCRPSAPQHLKSPVEGFLDDSRPPS